MKKFKEIQEATELHEARRSAIVTDVGDEGDSNIIYQLRKAINMRGKHEVRFQDGSKKRIEPGIARKILDKFQSLARPGDKQDFQNRISASPKALLTAGFEIAFSEFLNEEQLNEKTKLWKVTVQMKDPDLHKAPTIRKEIRVHAQDMNTAKVHARHYYEKKNYDDVTAYLAKPVEEALEVGTDEIRKSYAAMTPGQTQDIVQSPYCADIPWNGPDPVPTNRQESTLDKIRKALSGKGNQ